MPRQTYFNLTPESMEARLRCGRCDRLVSTIGPAYLVRNRVRHLVCLSCADEMARDIDQVNLDALDFNSEAK